MWNDQKLRNSRDFNKLNLNRRYIAHVFQYVILSDEKKFFTKSQRKKITLQ
jgi:hypothetical protein